MIMNQIIREEIEKLVNRAWKLHDNAKTEEEREAYKTDIMELLSKLPENVEILRIVQ